MFKMERWQIVFLCFFVILINEALAAEPLVLVTLDDQDKNHVRLMKQVLVDAYAELDMEIDLRLLPNKRSLEAVNSGLADGEGGRIAGMEKVYPNLVMVPEPLFSLKVLVYTKMLEFKVKGWNSLKPYRIGVLRGAKYAEHGTEGMDRVLLGSYGTQLFKALDAGRIDVVAMHESNNLALSGVKGVKILQPPLQEIILFHYLNKKHQKLIPALACAIKKVKKTINKKVEGNLDENCQGMMGENEK
ncbi:substrate-binding periplasmic protein [Zooshikella sp. RANM57]|uniref:substrate-binding periplasmic protein n=1 Tax=Zooshikella sp. RANM57 TaxID=3425863 RepID=UPI003D6DDBC0